MIGTDFYTLMPLQTPNHYSGLVDNDGYVLLGKFDTASTPDTTANVFQKGCQMTKTDAANSLAATYENTGTLASPAWTLLGTASTGITALTGDVTASGSGSVAATIAANAVTTAKILNANVTKAKLAAGIAASHMIVFAGSPTSVGGSATEAFTVTGAVGATDKAYVQVVNNGTGNVTVLQAVVTDNTLTVTFSADPQNDTVFNYQIIRATA